LSLAVQPDFKHEPFSTVNIEGVIMQGKKVEIQIEEVCLNMERTLSILPGGGGGRGGGGRRQKPHWSTKRGYTRNYLSKALPAQGQSKKQKDHAWAYGAVGAATIAGGVRGGAAAAIGVCGGCHR